MFIGLEVIMGFGMMVGFLVGIGWVVIFLGIFYLFEMKSLVVFLINVGYCVVVLIIMGVILGVW